MRTDSVLRRITAYILILIQLLVPVISIQPIVVKAEEPLQNQTTLQGLNELILGDTKTAVGTTKDQLNANKVITPEVKNLFLSYLIFLLRLTPQTLINTLPKKKHRIIAK
ncbi:hypothetical protein BFG07_00905 [Kosakonia cowanii]|nr:hypothetical protein BFG07_00905 [Kosakonia cowanii]